jgi:hypothetical protein
LCRILDELNEYKTTFKHFQLILTGKEQSRLYYAFDTEISEIRTVQIWNAEK